VVKLIIMGYSRIWDINRITWKKSGFGELWNHYYNKPFNMKVDHPIFKNHIQTSKLITVYEHLDLAVNIFPMFRRNHHMLQ